MPKTKNTVAAADVNAARAFGAVAYAAGAARFAGGCKNLAPLYAGREIGDPTTTAVLTAWLRGWDAANVAAILAT